MVTEQAYNGAVETYYAERMLSRVRELGGLTAVRAKVPWMTRNELVGL